MKKTSDFSVKRKGYETPLIRLMKIDEDVVTASATQLLWAWGGFDDSRDNTYIGG